ncbi:MAG: FAD-dependent oxidoreductase [Phycisphaerales bacterium]|nr:FAD-dependent oxidoreductase [Phycisphaerales bacterium]
MIDADVAVIGAGIAGLTCAIEAAEAGRSVVVLEASDAVGGRARTDIVDFDGGRWLLDRGFQVFLTAYPEARRLLDYTDLDLRPFYPGALVWCEGGLHRVADPWKKPLAAVRSFLTPVAWMADKARLGLLDAKLRRRTPEDLSSLPDVTSEAMLREAGFEDRTIDRFFRAFFGGVFFDRSLATTSRMLAFTYRMFATGQTTVPARGMGAIAAQLARRLGRAKGRAEVRLNAAAAAIEGRVVKLEGGVSLGARSIVIATDGSEARRLAGAGQDIAWNSTVTLWYAAESSPTREPVLVLDGEGEGPVNHAAVVSDAAAHYAPSGRALVSASVVGDGPSGAALEPQARAQLRRWFGDQVDRWRLIREDRIRRALPRMAAGSGEPAVAKPPEVREGVWWCGDHLDTASINGAMASGRRAAAAVLRGC